MEETASTTYKVSAKKYERTQFWEQVRRTVNGKPVSDGHIQMIINQIVRYMDFDGKNHLLDIGCGNGALAARLFDRVDLYTGIDYSAYLLGIANEFFRPNDRINYLEHDAQTWAASCENPAAFDRILIYGTMGYFSYDAFESLLVNFGKRFTNGKRIFIGNIPNIKQAPEFFAARGKKDYLLDNSESQIGCWWDAGRLAKLALSCGYSHKQLHMPNEFYGAKYRFDMLLMRTN